MIIKDNSLSNTNSLNNRTKLKNLPYSSNIFKKDFIRVLSAGNINQSKNCKNISIYKNRFILPTLNISSSTKKIKRIILNNSLPKNKYKLEIEHLYEQNINYKKTIQKLQLEINIMKNNINEKQVILNLMNEEIEKLLKENEVKFELDNSKAFSSYEKDRYIMIGKIKNKIREAEQGLKNEISNSEKSNKN